MAEKVDVDPKIIALTSALQRIIGVITQYDDDIATFEQGLIPSAEEALDIIEVIADEALND